MQWPARLSLLTMLGAVACAPETPLETSSEDAQDADGTGAAAPATASSGVGADDGGGSGEGGRGSEGGRGGPLDPGCSAILEIAGVAHVSTPEEPKKVLGIEQPGPTSWKSLRVELDVLHAGWSPKQGQYEVFTLLRANKWVGNAVGYIAFVGPSSRKTVMVANLNLPYAAAPDGRRITKSFAYEPSVTYHLDYLYDVHADLRELVVSVAGEEVSRVTGKVSNPPADPPVTSVEVPNGFTFLMGGEEVAEGPDAPTIDWQFSDVRITGCQ